MNNLLEPLISRIKRLVARSRPKPVALEDEDLDRLAFINWCDLWERIYRSQGFTALADSVAKIRDGEAKR